MVSRLSVVNALEKKGYLPNHPEYSYQVKLVLAQKFNMEQSSTKEATALDGVISTFASKVKAFYTDTKIAKREINRLKDIKSNWLSIGIKNPVPNEPAVSKPEPKKRKRKQKPGPKKKDFKESGRSGQHDKATNIKKDHSLESLIHAAMLKAHNEGNPDITWVLRELQSSPAVQGSRFRKAMEHYKKPSPIVCTPEEALALIIELRLSKNSYRKLRKKSKKKYAHFLPSYDPAVTDYMKKCKPENIDLTKSDEVSVPMQSVLDFQTRNILELPSVMQKHKNLKVQCEQSGLDYELKLFFKYGADGTSDQSEHKNVSAGL